MRAAPAAPLERKVQVEGRQFCVVASRFNGAIVERLVQGAVDALRARGAQKADIAVVWVPGALELPLAAKRVIDNLSPDAVICLGCVIEGGTDHYDHVCRATVDGVMRVGLDSDVVVTNGVLTVRTLLQAEERAGGVHGNKGAEAAAAAAELLVALDELGWPDDFEEEEADEGEEAVDELDGEDGDGEYDLDREET